MMYRIHRLYRHYILHSSIVSSLRAMATCNRTKEAPFSQSMENNVWLEELLTNLCASKLPKILRSIIFWITFCLNGSGLKYYLLSINGAFLSWRLLVQNRCMKWGWNIKSSIKEMHLFPKGDYVCIGTAKIIKQGLISIIIVANL